MNVVSKAVSAHMARPLLFNQLDDTEQTSWVSYLRGELPDSEMTAIAKKLLAFQLYDKNLVQRRAAFRGLMAREQEKESKQQEKNRAEFSLA